MTSVLEVSLLRHSYVTATANINNVPAITFLKVIIFHIFLQEHLVRRASC
jgi:hypothetical protein